MTVVASIAAVILLAILFACAAADIEPIDDWGLYCENESQKASRQKTQEQAEQGSSGGSAWQAEQQTWEKERPHSGKESARFGANCKPPESGPETIAG